MTVPELVFEIFARDLFCVIAFVAVIGGLIFTIDDLWIDTCAFVHCLKPRELDAAEQVRMNLLPQKQIAILVANWQEADILERMIAGNLERIEYQNYAFFLGVYPNDAATLNLARLLENRYANVFVVVNSEAGPTTKGQMLNQMAKTVVDFAQTGGRQFDLLLLHDSEDVLHPLSLKLINDSAESADFIQTPVFSFDVPLTSWVRGTYVDEFSESHTKDLLVRERLGAAIPSAGVGTALSRRLVLTYMKKGAGALLREDTLTEDYDLGLRTKALGFRSKFVCAYRRDLDGNPDYIATREFFPGRLKASIRQKTRWTLGIAFQGRDQFGWDGDLVDKYFLFRDRRGPLNSILIVFGLTTVMGFSGAEFSSLQLPAVLHGSFFVTLAAANGFNMVIRILQRARAVYRVHGLAQVAGIPIRWPVGSIINLAAASNAYFAHRVAQKTGQATKWEKTLHELPANFGQVAALQGKAMNLSTVQMEQQRSL